MAGASGVYESNRKKDARLASFLERDGRADEGSAGYAVAAAMAARTARCVYSGVELAAGEALEYDHRVELRVLHALMEAAGKAFARGQAGKRLPWSDAGVAWIHARANFWANVSHVRADAHAAKTTLTSGLTKAVRAALATGKARRAMPRIDAWYRTRMLECSGRGRRMRLLPSFPDAMADTYQMLAQCMLYEVGSLAE
jgi:hypothetical protein